MLEVYDSTFEELYTNFKQEISYEFQSFAFRMLEELSRQYDNFFSLYFCELLVKKESFIEDVLINYFLDVDVEDILFYCEHAEEFIPNFKKIGGEYVRDYFNYTCAICGVVDNIIEKKVYQIDHSRKEMVCRYCKE